MNSCKEYTDKQVRDYFLNRMTPEEMEAFQFHLLRCDICQRNLKYMRSLTTGWNEEEQEEDMPEVTSTRLDQRFLSLTFFTRVAAVAGLVLLLAGSGYYFMSAPSGKSIPVEMNEPPVYHAADSVIPDSTDVEMDSIDIDNIDIDDVE
jgi:hypothetical protein